jgi:NAD(P)-dependent dehydrogenase (short-subunit alcohol dehydrogenase family)
VLARELGPKKIRVNTISPGIVETEGTHSGAWIGSEFEKAALAQTPLGRLQVLRLKIGARLEFASTSRRLGG